MRVIYLYWSSLGGAALTCLALSLVVWSDAQAPQFFTLFPRLFYGLAYAVLAAALGWLLVCEVRTYREAGRRKHG